MIRNYLLITLRNVWKYKGHSLINILGLAVAISSCLLIFLYVQFEQSYDRMFQTSDQLYLVTEQDQPENPPYIWTKGKLIPEFLLQAHSGVKEGLRMQEVELDLEQEGRRFREEGYYADSTYFSVFPFRLLEGNSHTCLNRKDGVVISQRLAQKLFAESSAFGKVLKVNFQPYVIRGIMENQPENFSFQTDIVLPFSAIPEGGFVDWGNTNTLSVIWVETHTDVAQLATVLDQWANTRVTRKVTFSLFPLTENHLYDSEDKPRRRLYSLLLIAMVILVIASINFTNLVTVRAMTRNREIGVRKVLGATRKQLIIQFMGESMLMTLIATCLGAAFTDLLLPFFNGLMDLELTINYLHNPFYFQVLIGVGIGVGFLAGIYPSLVFVQIFSCDLFARPNLNPTQRDWDFEMCWWLFNFRFRFC